MSALKFAGLFRRFNRSMSPTLVTRQEPVPEASKCRDYHGVAVPLYQKHDVGGADEPGWRHATPGEMIGAHQHTIDQILDLFTGTRSIDEFERRITRIIAAFAAYTSTLPASRQHHHPGPGGLFAHSLDVAHKALHLSASFSLTRESTPQARGDDNLSWQLVVFLAGLLHDVGKVQSLGQVMAKTVWLNDRHGERRGGFGPPMPIYWRPQVCSFDRWVQAYDVESYMLDHIVDREERHECAVIRYINDIVPTEIRSFIYDANTTISKQFERFLHDPLGGSKDELNRIVKNADGISVAENMNPRTTPGAISITGQAARRMIDYAHESRWNLPNSPFLRAHVEVKRDKDCTELIQATFFVATEESISDFMRYFEMAEAKHIPLYEPSSARARESVFGALEKSGIFVPDVLWLNSVAKAEALPSYVPASMAHVLFVPPNPENVSANLQRFMVQLPLIPIGPHIGPKLDNGMPTLSFWGPPTQPYPYATPVRFDVDGTMKPEDPSRENDPYQIKGIEKFTDVALEKGQKKSLSPEQLKVLEEAVSMGADRGFNKSIQDSLQGSADRQSDPTADTDDEDADEPGQAAKPPSRPSARKKARRPADLGLTDTEPSLFPRTDQAESHVKLAQEEPGLRSLARPEPWVEAWKSSGSDACCVTAAVFLYMEGQNKARMEDGAYLMDDDCLTVEHRQGFKGEVTVRKLDHSRFRVWPREGDVLARQLKECLEADPATGSYRLSGDAVSMVETLKGAGS